MTNKFSNLIFNGDLSSQGVVGVPLFSEGQTVLRPFVFSFQAACDFAGVSVGGTRCFEFLHGSVLEDKKKRINQILNHN